MDCPPAPADNHCHDPVWLERHPHVAQTCDRIFKELRSKTREAEIVDRLERIDLNVRFEERDIGQSGRLGVRASGFEKAITTVEADDRTSRSKATGYFDCGVAPAASDVQDVIAAAERQRGKHLFAMQSKPSGEDVTPCVAFRYEHRITELNVTTFQ